MLRNARKEAGSEIRSTGFNYEEIQTGPELEKFLQKGTGASKSPNIVELVRRRYELPSPRTQDRSSNSCSKKIQERSLSREGEARVCLLERWSASYRWGPFAGLAVKRGTSWLIST